ncbi:hypothetical protein F5884DRAFT_93242 [Xylogone sp. PMI_703]|nr:hypothetical protein F5884DRAFT_93242 [Xylogone sp. PMI_703]
MVSRKVIWSSNATFKATSPSGLVAVFVGATSGIGQATLKHLAKSASFPIVYIIGRSQQAAAKQLDELRNLNPAATFNFIEAQISLMKEVDRVCDEIKSKESKVDILFISPGYITMGGKEETQEGIDTLHALRYYTRIRFTYNLLPLLNASPSARVITILAGGKEQPLDLTDLEVRRDYDAFKAARVPTTQMTLALEELARLNPSIAFIHKFPGFVNTGVINRWLIKESAEGTWFWSPVVTLARHLLMPFVNLMAMTPDEAGERGLFISTSARYPPAEPKEGRFSVPIPAGLEIARSSIVKDGKGNGVYRLDKSDEVAPDSGEESLAWRAGDAGKIVWEATLMTWERALARST